MNPDQWQQKGLPRGMKEELERKWAMWHVENGVDDWSIAIDLLIN